MGTVTEDRAALARALAGLAGGVRAALGPAGGRLFAGIGAIALAAGMVPGIASGETWRIVPAVSLTQTYTDNLDLAPSDQAQSAWVTNISPGIRIDLTGTRAKGFLDFRHSEFLVSSQSDRNNAQRNLSSGLTVEMVEKWLFVDASAGITQQSRSALGAAVSPDQPSASANANRVETTLLQLSPYVKGRLADVATYQVRFNASETGTSDSVLADTRTTEWTGTIKSALPSARYGWAVDLSTFDTRTDVAGRFEDSRIRGTVSFAPDPRLRLSVIEGYERTNFTGPGLEGRSTHGARLDWLPSERTQLGALWERRFFGDAHDVTFSHRTPRTAWRMAGARDSTVSSRQLSGASLGSIANLLSEQLSSAIPDPVAREEEVRRRLAESGISGSIASGLVFLTQRPVLARSLEASVLLQGAVNTVTLAYARREQSSLGASVAGVILDPVNENVLGRRFDATWSHRLTPLTSLTVAAISQQARDLAADGVESRQKAYRTFVTTRLGPKSLASFGCQYLDFATTAPFADYRERSVFVLLSMQL